MSDEATVLESSASPEVQARAREMGWIPPEKFQGDPERYVDAEEFVKNGEHVLPILRKTNETLRTQLTEVQSRQKETAAALKSAQEAIANIEERHSAATARAVERAKEDVKRQLAAASKDGDHEGVAELTEQLVELNAAKPEEKKEVAAKSEEPPAVDPVVQAWVNEKAPWYGVDRRKTALAMGIAQELKESGVTLTGRAFLDKVFEEFEKETAPRRAAAVDRTEAARNGGGAEPGSRGKTFADLPADAKASCQSDTKRFVGEGKKYKTAAEWHSAFAELYFKE